MNKCGFECGITSNFLEESEEAETEAEDYYFSVWYPVLEELSNTFYTPKSFIFTYDDLMNEEKIDDLIKILPNSECFAKLDTLSTKPTSSYKKAIDIINDFKSSHRTKDYFTKDMQIIIRKYVEITNIEFRCFVHQKKIRAISSEGNLINIEKIIKLVDQVTFYLEYESYTIDLTYHNDMLMIIEINTPVWLFSTSGLFCLDEPSDYHILLGEYIQDYPYPVIKINNYEY